MLEDFSVKLHALRNIHQSNVGVRFLIKSDKKALDQCQIDNFMVGV